MSGARAPWPRRTRRPRYFSGSVVVVVFLPPLVSVPVIVSVSVPAEPRALSFVVIRQVFTPLFTSVTARAATPGWPIVRRGEPDRGSADTAVTVMLWPRRGVAGLTVTANAATVSVVREVTEAA